MDNYLTLSELEKPSRVNFIVPDHFAVAPTDKPVKFNNIPCTEASGVS